MEFLDLLSRLIRPKWIWSVELTIVDSSLEECEAIQKSTIMWVCDVQQESVISDNNFLRKSQKGCDE